MGDDDDDDGGGALWIPGPVFGIGIATCIALSSLIFCYRTRTCCFRLPSQPAMPSYSYGQQPAVYPQQAVVGQPVTATVVGTVVSFTNPSDPVENSQVEENLDFQNNRAR